MIAAPRIIPDLSPPNRRPPTDWTALYQARFRERQCADLPPSVADFAIAECDKLTAAGNRPAANLRLAQGAALLRRAHISKAYDDEVIRDCAVQYARIARRCKSYSRVLDYVRSKGITPPPLRCKRLTSVAPMMARFSDEYWWRRQLRKIWTRQCENGLRELGMVRKGRAHAVSNAGLDHWERRQRAQMEWLKSCTVKSDSGDQLELWDVRQASLANPKNRRTELMVRMRGFDEIAKFHKHVGLLVTLTCPSAFHAQHIAGGANARFEHSTVRDAQMWLCKMWARVRAKCKRLAILMYGFRVAEAHHDGTPHWHLVLFMPARDVDTVRFIIRAYWLSEYADEPNAEAVRCSFKEVDPAQGSATGYLAKYIAKGIDGHGQIGEALDHETDEKTEPNRIRTWASIHGIRQFQQIGGPAAALWRECRRLREPVADIDIERARAFAGTCKPAQFIGAVGGIAAGRRTNLQLEKVETGARNYYGELRPPQIIGLRYASAVELTRLKKWHMEQKCLPGTAPRNSGSVCLSVTLSPQLLSGSITAAARKRLTAYFCKSATLPAGRRAARDNDRLWLSILSDLGPVSITVRGSGNPSGWTNPQETSMYGPH